jgi:two-component system repressor protein LuxO
MCPGQGSDAAARMLLIDRDGAAGDVMAANLAPCFEAPPLVEHGRGGREAAAMLRAGSYDIVLADLASLRDLADATEDAVARLVKLASGALLVALSDGTSVSAAVAAMRAGAHDFVAKPIVGPDFATRIGELAQRHGKSWALAADGGVSTRSAGLSGLLGTSSQMQVVYEQIARIAPSSAPIFITGERGTGKDLCAEALHGCGPRADRHFVAVNCAAIPPALMERELFGEARGAYTGTQVDRKGAAELADGGTLYLDEIGELDLSLQAKLLRFLQTGTLNRMGESAARPVDVRVICATNRNPMQLIAERKFREDLFYRLHVLPIHLPPLRQRPGDIPVLAQHFLTGFSREEYKRFTGFSGECLNLLAARDWPGNVRQLKTLVHRLVVMFEGGEINAGMLAAADPVAPAPELSAPAPANAPAVLPMWQQEQRIIEDAIACFSGNIALAAAALELSPSTIYRKRQAWSGMDEGQGAA